MERDESEESFVVNCAGFVKETEEGFVAVVKITYADEELAFQVDEPFQDKEECSDFLVHNISRISAEACSLMGLEVEESLYTVPSSKLIH